LAATDPFFCPAPDSVVGLFLFGDEIALLQERHVLEGDGTLDQLFGQLILLVILKGQGRGTVQTLVAA